MAAITISRQAGSHGARIARAVARELGWEFADKSTINRVIGQYGLHRLNKIYDHEPKLGELFNDNSAVTIEMMNATIGAIAARGDVVILGRGAFAVLKDASDVLNVFVGAPLEKRVERIARRDGIDLERAARNVRRDDRLRRRFTRLYYRANWEKSKNYDLVISTEHLSDGQAVEAIVAAARALPSRGWLATSTAHVDPILAETLVEVMGSPGAEPAEAPAQ